MLTIRQEISPNGKSGVFYDGGREEIGFLILSLRGGSGAKDAAIHRVSADAGGVVCSLTEGQWIATGYALAMTRCGDGYPRDDKSGISTMKGMKRLELLFCHCEEDSMDDAAIHRVSEDANGFVCSGCEVQWIATPARGSR